MRGFEMDRGALQRMPSFRRIGTLVQLASRRIKATIGGVCAAVLIVGLIASPGGALGRLQPHESGFHGDKMASRTQNPQSSQPLTLANIQVTNLANNQTSVYSWSAVAPAYSQNDDCNLGALHPLCMSYGEASGPNGGFFRMSVGPPGLQAGSFYSDIGGQMTVTAGGASCGQGGTDEPRRLRTLSSTNISSLRVPILCKP